MLPVAKIHQSPCSVRCRDRNVSPSGYHGRILDQAYNMIWRRMGSFRGNRWAVHSPRFSPCISLSPFLATPQPSSTSTMSTRHSFLSTTGLIRPTSVASAASVADSYYIPNRHARSGGTTTRNIPKVATPQLQEQKLQKPLVTRAGIIPLGPTFVVGMAVMLSLLFVAAISLAFIPDDDEVPAIARVLDDIAANTPGVSIVLRLHAKDVLTFGTRLSYLAATSMSTSMSPH